MTAPLRAQFVNQAGLRGGVMGHVRLEQVIRHGLAGRDDVVALFSRLGAWGPGARVVGGRIPGLHAMGLDLHVLRWHIAEGIRGRRARAAGERRLRPDVVHVNTHTLAFAMGRALRRTPTVLSLDATVARWLSLGRQAVGAAELRGALALERRALRGAALVLAWSRQAADDALAAAPGARVAVLPPGIEVDVYTPGARAPRERPRVLFVGGRFADKGGPDLLAALAPRLGRDAELDVVTPHALAPRPGLRVHSLQPGSPALLELYRQADVFCLPTHQDTYGFALLEAMACGTAVIATDVAGLPENLDGGRAGLLVGPRDVRALRAALDRLLDDAELRRRLGAAAREHVLREHDARRQTDRLVAHLRAAARCTMI